MSDLGFYLLHNDLLCVRLLVACKMTTVHIVLVLLSAFVRLIGLVDEP